MGSPVRSPTSTGSRRTAVSETVGIPWSPDAPFSARSSAETSMPRAWRASAACCASWSVWRQSRTRAPPRSSSIGTGPWRATRAGCAESAARDDYVMADRERALAAVCDTFVAGYAALPSASALGTHRLLRSEVEALERPALVAELDQFLDTIESPVANLLLIGRAVRFSALCQAERADCLKRWAGSPIPLKRKAFQVLKRLSLLYTYGL